MGGAASSCFHAARSSFCSGVIALAPSFGEVGEKFTLELTEGGSVTGKVLAKTKRETALGWDAILGVLELKAFAMGPQKMVSVHGCGWGLSAARAKEIEVQMERALERLADDLGSTSASA
ncbi:MAG TPA: hypothetical protein VHF01_08670 [Candidatus Acidoferrum sp.]|nr:hypothetical protein [Candidatus Acidoferrum sp.]